MEAETGWDGTGLGPQARCASDRAPDPIHPNDPVDVHVQAHGIVPCSGHETRVRFLFLRTSDVVLGSDVDLHPIRGRRGTSDGKPCVSQCPPF